MRYIVEILEEIRKEVGSNMIIEVRMSANEFKEGGIDINKGIRIAEALQKYADVAPVFWPAGDCVKARTVEMAVREGYFAGINI